MLGVIMKAISVAASKLNPRVTQSYLLNNLLAAFAAITERRELGKVILTMG
jgi:NADPH:quinone reductase-like Zn-dependent oxidoreductase